MSSSVRFADSFPKEEAKEDLSTAAARQSLPEGEAEEGGCLFV